jgi:hypothetical protein
MNVDIQVVSSDSIADLNGLLGWLRQDDDLGAAVRSLAAPPRPGDLGAGVDHMLIAAVTSAATTRALARCVISWIQHRGTAVDVTLVAADGGQIHIVGTELRKMSAAEIGELVQQAALLHPDRESSSDEPE